MSIKDLLKSLAEGLYDGERTDSELNGVSLGFYIDKGTHIKYREGRRDKAKRNHEKVDYYDAPKCASGCGSYPDSCMGCSLGCNR